MRLVIISLLMILMSPVWLWCAGTVENFEDQSTICADEYWGYDVYTSEGDLQSIDIVPGGANGTDYCGRTAIMPDSSPTSDNDHCSTPHTDGYYYGRNYTDIDDAYGGDTNSQYMPTLAGSDRLSFYIKLPSDFPQITGEATAVNFELGAYPTDDNGDILTPAHPYHFFNIKPSSGGYWTRCIANAHPQHITSISGDPGNNPYGTDYNYWQMNRLYFETLPCWPVDSVSYYFYLDEVIGIVDTESQDDTYIAGLYCTYHGSGQFTIGWNGSTMYADVSDTYDVYYATTALTNSNYTASGTLGADDLEETEYGYDISNYYETTINTGITSGTVYFAIKCNNAGAPAYVSKIDYPIDSGSTPSACQSGCVMSGGSSSGGG